VDPRNILIPVAATPILQAILNFAGLLRLEPLAHWGWNADFIFPITYVVTTGSATVACLWAAKTNRAKAILIGIGMLVLLISLRIYTSVLTLPPENIFLYDLSGYTSFFLTYFSFGFVVARIVKFFSQRK
jgi:hypothetical protein